MYFFSTRDPKKQKISLSDAILSGMAPDGGLFFPEKFSQISTDFSEKSFLEIAKKLFENFTGDDFSAAEISQMIEKSYQKCAPRLKKLSDEISILELFHGPTGAFKDFALQFLPRLLSAAIAKKSAPDALVLVATSGDTGGAALAGFADIPKTSVACFFPENGVSPLQKAQMQNAAAENLGVFEFAGDFDFAQKALKTIFTDQKFAAEIFEKFAVRLSSANSINIGRLLPQIFYVFWALKNDKNPVNLVIPTGNFGDACAAFLAKKMGAPVGKIFIATNKNGAVARAILTGIFDLRGQKTQKTKSPAMDILRPSNFERILFWAADFDANFVADFFEKLEKTGVAKIPENILKKIQKHFSAAIISDDKTLSKMAETFKKSGYLPDPHTAVALAAADKISEKKMIFSTAHFAKFGKTAFSAIFPEKNPPKSETAILREIQKIAKSPEITDHFFEILEKKPTKKAKISGEFSAIKKSIFDFLKSRQK